MMVLNKKNGERDGFVVHGLGRQEGEEGGKKKAAKSEKLVHSMDIISSFATLGLTAPTTKSAEAMESLITNLGEKKQEYLEKRKEAHVKRAKQKEEIAAQIAAGKTEEAEEAKENGAAAAPVEAEATEAAAKAEEPAEEKKDSEGSGATEAS